MKISGLFALLIFFCCSTFAVDPLMSSDPEVAIKEANYLLFEATKPLDEPTLDRLHAFAQRDLRLHFPSKVQIDYGADLASIQTNLAKQARQQLAWSMQQALDFVATHERRKDRAASTARKVLTQAKHANRRVRALAALLENNLADPADIVAYQKIKTSPKYGSYHIELALKHRATQPAAELLVVEELSNPLVDVRSRAVDVLRNWGELKDPVAQKKLAKLIPKLTGFAKQVAQNLLEHSPLGDSLAPQEEEVLSKLLEDDIYEQRQLGQIKNDSPKRLPRVVEVPSPGAVGEIVPIRNENLMTGSAEQHSMPHFTGYLQERLGPAVYQQVLQNQVQVTVYAGTEKSLLASTVFRRNPGGSPHTVRSIPSPYEVWGIQKYINTSVTPPQLVIRIPPIPAYAKHYDSMLRSIPSETGAATRVLINTKDQTQMSGEFRSAASRMVQRIEQTAPLPDVIAMGYDYIWKSALENSKDWKIISSHTVEESEGLVHLRARVFEIQLRRHPRKPISLVVLGSDRVLWGEATSEAMVAFLQASPKTQLAVFAGSAGAPGFRDTYSLALPGSIVDAQKQRIPLRNALITQEVSTHPTVRPVDDSRVLVYSHHVHGASVSPAEQTRAFVAKHYTPTGPRRLDLYALGGPRGDFLLVDTVDVETHLLATKIAEINRARPKADRILFGALHVITDHPNVPELTWDVGHSLDAIHQKRKARARQAGVEEVLVRLAHRFDPRWKCFIQFFYDEP